jgi:hypothetical protein
LEVKLGTAEARNLIHGAQFFHGVIHSEPEDRFCKALGTPKTDNHAAKFNVPLYFSKRDAHQVE